MAVRTPLRTTTSGCVMFFFLLLLYCSELLLHECSTINIQGRAGDVVAIYDEVADTTSNILRCTSPTERYSSNNRLFRLFWYCLIHLRRYITGTDSVNRHIRAS